MKRAATLIVALMAGTLLAGCALLGDTVERVHRIGDEYCERLTEQERQALRHRINTGWDHRLELHCNAPDSPQQE